MINSQFATVKHACIRHYYRYTIQMMFNACHSQSLIKDDNNPLDMTQKTLRTLSRRND